LLVVVAVVPLVVVQVDYSRQLLKLLLLTPHKQFLSAQVELVQLVLALVMERLAVIHHLAQLAELSMAVAVGLTAGEALSMVAMVALAVVDLLAVQQLAHLMALAER